MKRSSPPLGKHRPAGGGRSKAAVRAVADIGSNSIHLLVAITDGTRLSALTDESLPSDLGRLVEQRGEIGRKGTADIVSALSAFRSRATALGADSFEVVATEPLRRAKDRTSVLKELRRGLGLEMAVLSHEEEGLLTVLGLIHPHDRSTPLLVADIGGGSTEIVGLHPLRQPVAQGFSIGSARLMTRFGYSDPPKRKDWRALREYAHDAFSSLPAMHASRMVLVGGTGTRLLKLVPKTLLSHKIEPEDLQLMGDRLSSHSAAEVSRTYALSERRVRLLPAGLAILEALLQQTEVVDLTVDRGGIREGVIISSALAGGGWRDSLSALVTSHR